MNYYDLTRDIKPCLFKPSKVKGETCQGEKSYASLALHALNLLSGLSQWKEHGLCRQTLD